MRPSAGCSASCCPRGHGSPERRRARVRDLAGLAAIGAFADFRLRHGRASAAARAPVRRRPRARAGGRTLRPAPCASRAARRRIPGPQPAGRRRARARYRRRHRGGAAAAGRPCGRRPGACSSSALHPTGAPAFVDYAHKPDALAKALEALRPHTTGRLVVVFGCGGDRDAGKRPLMGEIAARLADRVIVTDDNPRSEDAGRDPPRDAGRLPGAVEIGDREEAIRGGLRRPEAGDTLLVAGKGHETGPDRRRPGAAVRRRGGAARGGPRRRRNRRMSALWTAERSPRRPAARIEGDWVAVRASRSTRRTLAPGDLFVALTGPQPRRPRLRGRGVRARGGGGAGQPGAGAPRPTALWSWSPTPGGARAASAGPRAPAAAARIAGVTGSVGKTGTKEALRAGAGARRRRPTPAPPATTIIGACRCASPACRAGRELRRVRAGHEPCRARSAPLTRQVRRTWP